MLYILVPGLAVWMCLCGLSQTLCLVSGCFDHRDDTQHCLDGARSKCKAAFAQCNGGPCRRFALRDFSVAAWVSCGPHFTRLSGEQSDVR